MATTRDFNSLGVFAKDAEAGFVGDGQERIIGDAYRNVKFSNFQQLAGKGFNNQPVSENVNQQLNNQSQFTDFLNGKGILGWKDDITYNVPAVVLASNGKVYQALKDNLNNNDPTDPINGNPDDPQFWQELVGFTELELDLSSQVPGDEGAEQVGTFNEFFKVGGRTLQKSLDENAQSLFRMHNFNIQAYYRDGVNTDTTVPSNLRRTFNIDTINVVVNSVQVNGNDINGYAQINFINPISADSMVLLNIVPFGQTVSVGNKIVKHATSNAWSELTVNNIKVGSLSLTQIEDIDPGSGFEDLSTRAEWDVMLMIYTIEP